MLETATTQTELHAAFQRAHEERAQAFRAAFHWCRTTIMPPVHSAESKKGQPERPAPELRCPA